MLFCALVALPASAQVGVGTLIVAVEPPAGQSADGAVFEATSTAADAPVRSAVVEPGSTTAVLTVGAGRHDVRVTLGPLREARATLDVAPGSVTRLTARLTPADSMAIPRLSVTDRHGVAHQFVFGQQALENLPTSGTVGSLLETAHPFVITDRMDTGGLWSNTSPKVGGYGSSWSQVSYLVDGLDVSDPVERGTPILFPDLGPLQGVQVDGVAMTADVAGPGLAISMVPRRAGSAWKGSAQGAFVPTSWQGDPGAVVSSARFDRWADGGGTFGGPLSPSAGLVASARVTSGRRTERDDPMVLENDLQSAYVHLFTTPRPGDQLRVMGSANGATRPYAARARFADRDLDERTSAAVLTSTWERARGARLWSLGAGYRRAATDARVDASAAGGAIERLIDGPALALAETAPTSRQAWDLSASLMPHARQWGGRAHVLSLGASLSGSSASSRAVAQPRFAEFVDGLPARVWDVQAISGDSSWSALSAGAFASDRLLLGSHVTVNAGLRFDYDRGSASGADNTIQWANLSPRASVRWSPTADGRFAITTGYAWYRQRLPLSYFAVGDPAGMRGTMYRWDDVNGDRRFTSPELQAVATVGAGGAQGAIDPDLVRPSTAEFLLHVEHRLFGWRWHFTGIDRRERDNVGLVNTGLTAQDYAVSFVTDPGIDILGNAGYEQVPVYSRHAASFGRDRYLLTNPAMPAGRFQSAEIGFGRSGDGWYYSFEGMAYRGEGIGGSLGFRPEENDQGVLGESFTSPNAGTFSRGRLFFDRAFVIKTSGSYRAPGGVNTGFVARYQDGQPFSRLLVATGLGQGTDLVQVYPRGGQRFTFTISLDARVEKTFVTGKSRVGLTLDVFNLLDNRNEVEEDIVTGPAFRTETLWQPARAFRVGARIAF